MKKSTKFWLIILTIIFTVLCVITHGLFLWIFLSIVTFAYILFCIIEVLNFDPYYSDGLILHSDWNIIIKINKLIDGK